MKQWIIGIDEVGRGPLAGPVVVCALACIANSKLKENGLPPLRDSKKLSAAQRERWCAWIKKQPNIFYALARVNPKKIDRINITEAANLAATRACLRVCKKLNIKSKTRVFLDGGLYVNQNSILTSGHWLDPQTIIRGDETIPAISLASIVAKVSRDRYMCKLDKRFPQYDFAIHKGYGTRAHMKALKKYGPCVVHRKTFIRAI